MLRLFRAIKGRLCFDAKEIVPQLFDLLLHPCVPGRKKHFVMKLPV